MKTVNSNLSIRSRGNVGLDIGPYSIKVVKLVDRRGKRVLKNIGIKEIPPSPPLIKGGIEGGIRGDIASIAQLIEELFAEAGIKNRGVVLAIPSSSVIFKVILVPKMPESELREAIKWELKRRVQLSVEDSVLDYSNLGTVMENGVPKFKLLVVAAHKDVVEEQLAIIKEAGLYAEGIDAAPFAVWRAFEDVVPASRVTPTERETIAIVDIGCNRTSINLVKDNVLQFTRDAKIGSDNITEALLAPIVVGAERLNLEYDEAESLKRRYGIPSWDSNENTGENIPLSEIFVIMKPVLEKLLVEIGRSFDFFASQLHAAKIDKVILSGGGAMLKGLPEFLAQGLRIDVEVANPFQNIISEVKEVNYDEWLHEMSPNFAVATGLALPALKRIDLIPQEIRIRKQKIVQGVVFAAISSIILFTFAFLYLDVDEQLSVVQKELSTKRDHLSALNTPATKLPQLRKLRERVKREKTLLPKEPFKLYHWEDIMKEISNAIPPKAMLTSLSVETKAPEASPVEGANEGSTMQGRKLIRLKGIIFDKDPDDRIGLNKFIRFLEASPLFTNISLISMQESTEYEQIGKDFEFTCVPVSERRKYR